MMFSTRAEYGVRVMVDLARRGGADPVPLAEIADCEGLPLAYLEHRLTFMWTFLARDKLVLELFKLDLPDGTPMAHNAYFMALMPLYDALKSTILFRAGLWLILGIAVIGWAWRARATPDGTFAISIAASGLVYLLTFGVLGVATDFRYAYWGVLASLAGLVPALLAGQDASAGRNFRAQARP